MKFARKFLVNTLVGGLLIVLPIYLTVLVLLKGMRSVVALVRPEVQAYATSKCFTRRTAYSLIRSLEDLQLLHRCQAQWVFPRKSSASLL